MNSSRRHYYDDFYTLSDYILGANENINKQNASKFPICPRLVVCLFAVPTSALLDTGSQITAMSDTLYEYLKKYNNITELPVSNVVLLTAIGKKGTFVKKQVLCELQIGELKYQTSFLVVPNLSNALI